MRSLKGMQCPSSKAVEDGVMGARGGDLEVLQRPGLEIGIAQSVVTSTSSFVMNATNVACPKVTALGASLALVESA